MVDAMCLRYYFNLLMILKDYILEFFTKEDRLQMVDSKKKSRHGAIIKC